MGLFLVGKRGRFPRRAVLFSRASGLGPGFSFQVLPRLWVNFFHAFILVRRGAGFLLAVAQAKLQQASPLQMQSILRLNN